jgi:LuxR family maltose regulon positive regulatory protein
VSSNDQATPFRPHRSQRPTIHRPRLLRTLNSGLGDWATAGGFATRLTLVTGPAGFGKTTVVADWLSVVHAAHPELRLHWLDLEPGHDDPVRFGRALLAAFDPSAVSDGDPDPVLPLAGSLAQVLRAVDAPAAPSIVVIDDYHLITHPLIHTAVNDLVGHLSPATHLVLVSRADPVLPLARLRTQRAMTELRARDLRFSAEESADFLRTVMGLNLTAEEVAVLERETEGWVAGLQLAAHSLRLEEDTAGFLAAFAGDDRYVADYLMEEVLLRQPPDIQAFLLQTSILDRLTPELCDAVTGRDDSGAILAALDQANLFVVPLDARRHAYRYHRLFADLLSVRLLESREDETVLHRRAAAWLMAEGQTAAAVEHALATGDTAYAADLITRAAPGYFAANELTALVRRLKRLPPETIGRRPRLCLGGAWAALATGDPDLAERYVSLLEPTLGRAVADLCTDDPLEPGVAAALIEAAAVRSRIRIAWLDAPGALSLCRCALARLDRLPDGLEDIAPDALPADPAGWPLYFNPPAAIKPVLLFNQGLAYALDNRVADAAGALTEAAGLAQPEGNAHLVALALGHLAQVQRIQGRLTLAEATCERGLRLVERLSGALTPLAGVLIAQQGHIAYARGENETADPLWRRAIELALPWENWEALLPAYVGLALLSRARGDWLSAHDALDSLLEITADQTDVCLPIATAYRAWFWAEAGETHAARQWADSLSEAPRRHWGYMLDLENLCRARVYLALGEVAPAEALARQEADRAAAEGRWGRWIDIQTTYALALLAGGRRQAAQEALEAALVRAADENHVLPFVEAGPVIEPLLQQALASPGVAATTARRVLAALPSAEPAADGKLIDLGPDGGLLEALTEREAEVLHHIAIGLSNREIADALYLTEGTVKNHAHNIYSKLDANGRTHAVARARALGLLDPTP